MDAGWTLGVDRNANKDFVRCEEKVKSSACVRVKATRDPQAVSSRRVEFHSHLEFLRLGSSFINIEMIDIMWRVRIPTCQVIG